MSEGGTIDLDVLREEANASPYYRLLGMEVEEASPTHARVIMRRQEGLLQFQDAIHGGAIFSVADAAVAIASLIGVAEGTHALTIEGKLNYTAPARGEVVTAEATIAQRGRKIVVGEVRVTDEDGTLVATGIMTYMLKLIAKDAA